MGMSLFWILPLVAIGVGTLCSLSCTRSAKLARIARLANCKFDKEKTTITTQLTAGRLEFLTNFFHQYRNVFTYTHKAAFLRIADDHIFLNDDPRTTPLCYTLFTAELKKRQFPALKIAPLKSPFAPSQYTLMKTNIPAVDTRYRIHAPSPAAGVLFTPFITGLLKTRANIYLELNDSAIIYHEHTLIAPQELEAFRFRALQLLGEFEILMNKLDAQAAGSTASLSITPPDEIEKRAQEMLQSLGGTTPQSSTQPGKFRAVWIAVMLALLSGVLVVSWVALTHWVK